MVGIDSLKYCFWLVVISSVVMGVFADDLANETIIDNSTVIGNLTLAINETGPIDTPAAPVSRFEIVEIQPKAAAKGDVLLSVKLKNNGNVLLQNLIPILVAKGFSAYDVVPIKALEPGTDAISYISGEFSAAGNILLTLKINDELFYDKIVIEDIKAADTEQKKLEETAIAANLDALNAQFEDLKDKYKELEIGIIAKRNDYELTDVKLDDMKRYLLDAQINILSGSLQKANVSLMLALTEYNDQRFKLDHAPVRPFLQKIKDNLLLISGIATAIITMISFYELMKKKKQDIVQTVKSVRIGNTSQVIIEKTDSVDVKEKSANP